MPPQGQIPVVSNVLGTIGTVLWCLQLVPQIIHNWRRKDTEGLPAMMMLLWAICAVPFGVYAIVQRFGIAIQIQPQVFCVLALINWGQILYYNKGWKTRNAVLLVTGLNVLFGGLEALLALTLQGPYSRGVTWPIEFIGILAAVFLAAGLLPPYWEIYKRSGRVIGIDWIFLTVDWNGGLFSLLAVCTQQTFDVLGGMIYILVIVLEAGIFVSHGIWLLRTRKERKKQHVEEQQSGELEDVEAAEESQPARSPVTEAEPKTNEREDVAHPEESEVMS